jgi:hypothetical protein
MVVEMVRSRPRPSAMFEWLGWRVDDCQGRRIGTVHAVYEDEATGVPAWFLVRLGRFSSRYVLVPPADLMAWTGRVRLPFARETLERAPLLFTPPPHTTAALEAQLRRHYRMASPAPGDVTVVARRTVA